MKKSRIIGATWRIRLLPSSDGSDADAREFGNAQDLRRHRPIRERPLDPQSAYRCQSSADQIIDGPCLAPAAQQYQQHHHPTGYASATPEGSRILIGRLSKFLASSQLLSPYRGDANQPFRCY
jgi:hypothetical protein